MLFMFMCREAMKQLQHEDHVNEQITDILSHEGLDPKQHDEGTENIHRVINRSVHTHVLVLHFTITIVSELTGFYFLQTHFNDVKGYNTALLISSLTADWLVVLIGGHTALYCAKYCGFKSHMDSQFKSHTPRLRTKNCPFRIHMFVKSFKNEKETLAQ